MKPIFIILALMVRLTTSWAQPPDHLEVNLQFSDAQLLVGIEYLARPEVASDSLFFILNPMNRLDTIISHNLVEYTSGKRPDRPFPGQVLYFDGEFEQGQELPITFSYAIDLSASNHWDAGWIELNVDKLWFPIRGDLDNDITYNLSIQGLPEDFDLVSHMDASMERQGDRIQISQVHPVQEVLILAGSGMRHRQLSENIEFFAGRQVPDSVLQSMHQKVLRSIEFLNETVGNADPISDFRVVLRNTSRSELGFQFNRKNMIVTGPDFDDYGNLSHEIAHYWCTGADFIREPWMNESFANFLMFLVLERFDPEKYKSLQQRYRGIATKAPSVNSATLFSEGAYQAYYHKGSMLLVDLESTIGKPKMLEVLRRCISEDVHSTEGFLSTLQDVTSVEVRNDFEWELRQ